MKVVLFNGSPRPEGNTARLLRVVSEHLEAQGISTEQVPIGSLDVKGCLGGFECMHTGRCIYGDCVQEYLDKMIESDGFVFGSSVYSGNVSSQMKAFMDRITMMAKAHHFSLSLKVGAAIAVSRKMGALSALDAIYNFMLNKNMIVVGSSYWTFGLGLTPGSVSEDTESLIAMKNLSNNMAWIIKKIAGHNVERPVFEIPERYKNWKKTEESDQKKDSDEDKKGDHACALLEAKRHQLAKR